MNKYQWKLLHMKIGIDIQTTLGQKTGFGFYVDNLVKHLKKYNHTNIYKLYKPTSPKDFNAPQRFWWDQFVFPNMVKTDQVDILHQPCFSAPVFYKGKIVVTIHDLIAIKFGQDIPFYSRQFFGKWMPFSYRYADRIIAISEHTKKDIIKILKIPKEKIRVIYEAADEACKYIPDKLKIEKTKTKYDIYGDYLIHIGTINPRKNLEFLIKVFSKVVKTYPKIKLVITGKKGWYYEGLFKLVKKLGLQNKVVFTGYIEDEEKPILYTGAKIFLFPSLYEGFGLPILESMACRTPVISSNTSSLPELVGDAGILLDPKDKIKWVKTIKKILSNQLFSQKLIEASIYQLKKFSWDRCAKETIKVYQNLYHEK